MEPLGETRPKCTPAKEPELEVAAHAPHQMNQRSGQPKMAAHGPQMGAHNAQMGGKHPQTAGGGNRPAPKAQPQGKKKPGQPNAAESSLEAPVSNGDRHA